MIDQIAIKLGFPEEAVTHLSECERKMEEKAAEKLSLAEASLFTKNDNAYLDLLEEIANESEVHRYECDMAFLLRCVEPLHRRYRKAGYCDELFYDTMADLRYKLKECNDIFGLWGTFVTPWFKGFYLLERFKLGRMQYERIEFPFESYKDVLKKGDVVLSCHIPSDGPMLEDDIRASLRLAYDFYKDDRALDGRLAVMCFSWLLYPPIFESFNEASNIKKFYNLFDVIESHGNEKNNDFWRVFGVRYSPEAPETVKADNSLRRAVLDHLKNGGSMGSGSGILFVDEEY